MCIQPPASGLFEKTWHAMTAPLASTKDSFNYILDHSNPYLKSLLDQLSRRDFDRNLIDSLSDLLDRPDSWGIPSHRFPRESVETLLDLIQKAPLEEADFESALAPLRIEYQESLGIIPHIFHRIEHEFDRIISRCSDWGFSLLKDPEKFSEFIEICQEKQVDRFKKWIETNQSDLVSIFFDNPEILTADQEELLCLIERENLEAPRWELLLKSFYPYFSEKTSVLARIKLTFHHLIEDKKSEVQKIYEEATTDVPVSLIEFHTTLQSLPSQTIEDQKKSLSPFFSIFSIDDASLKSLIFGPVEFCPETFDQIKAFISTMKHGPKESTLRLAQKVAHLLDLVIKKRQGILQQMKRAFNVFLSKELRSPPPLLTTALSLMLSFPKKSSPLHTSSLLHCLEAVLENHFSIFDSEDQRKFHRLIEELKAGSVSTPTLSQAQKSLFNRLKSLEGSLFQLVDHTKSLMIDRRTGLLPNLIDSTLDHLKTTLLDEYPKELLLAETLILDHQHKRITAKVLKEEIAKIALSPALSDEERSFLKTLNPKHLDTALSHLNFLKNCHQGLIPGLGLSLRHHLLDPIRSFFSTEKKSEFSFVSQLFDFVEREMGNGTQFLILSTFEWVYEWIKKTQFKTKTAEEKKRIESFFEDVIAKIESTNFFEIESRKALIQFIQSQIGPYQIMIDHVIALPNFYKIQNSEELESFTKALESEDPKEQLKTWTKKLGGISRIRDALFHHGIAHCATDSEIEEIESIIKEITENNLSRLSSLKHLIRETFFTSDDTKSDYLSLSVDSLKKVDESLMEKDALEESLPEVNEKLGETLSFFLLYQLYAKILGIDHQLNEAKKSHETLLRDIAKLPSKEQESAYHKKLEDIDYADFEALTFSALVKDLPSIRRREEFFDRLELLFFDQPNLAKIVLKNLAPFLFRFSQLISKHILERTVHLAKHIGLITPVDVEKRLNTDLIKQMTRFFNKIKNSFESIPIEKPALTVPDILTDKLNQDIYYEGETISIPVLISRVNQVLIEKFFPKLALYDYFEGLSTFFLNHLFSKSHPALFFLKAIFLIPSYFICLIIKVLIGLPLDAVVNFTAKKTVCLFLDFTSLTLHAITHSFKNLKNKTGIYHTIKKPIGKVLEEVSIDKFFTPKDEHASSDAILSQQDAAKRDIGEMYQSYKTAASWFIEGTSVPKIEERSLKMKSTPPSLIDEAVQSFETEFFSEFLTDKLLQVYHHITQPKFLEESVLVKGIKSLDSALHQIDRLETKDSLQAKKNQSMESDNQLKRVSHEFLSKMFDRALHHALKEFGANLQKILDTFFDWVKENFSEPIEFDPDFESFPIEKKLDVLNRLRKDLMAKIADLITRKQTLIQENSIPQRTSDLVQQTVLGLEKTLFILAERLEEILTSYQAEYEQTLFKDSIDTLFDLEKQIHFELEKNQTHIQRQHRLCFKDFDCVMEKFEKTLNLIRPYSIGHSHLHLSYFSRQLKSHLRSFFVEARSKKTILEDQSIKLRLYYSVQASLKSKKLDESSFLWVDLAEKIEEMTKDLHQIEPQLNRLIRKANRKWIPTHLDELKTILSTFKSESEEFLKVSDFHPFVKVEVKKVKPELLKSFRILTEKVPELTTKISKIEFVNIELAESLGIIDFGKKIILKKVKTELEKHKAFFNSNEILESFFYNCILTSIK